MAVSFVCHDGSPEKLKKFTFKEDRLLIGKIDEDSGKYSINFVY